MGRCTRSSSHSSTTRCGLCRTPRPAPVQRTVLAARVVDRDPHGLDVGTPLHGLTISLLAAAAELDPRRPARDMWAVWNVVVDPVSSNVAVLNLPAMGEGALAGWSTRPGEGIWC